MNIEDRITQQFGAGQVTFSRYRDNHRAVVAADRLFALLSYLKQGAGFDQLSDITAVDYLEFPDAVDRFGVVYVLLNTLSGERLIVKTFVNEPDLKLPSAVSLWQGANWLEREVYDMFGIVFAGHPDLRRILMPEEFTAFPLRKDYPLRGRGERHNFPVITRAES
ncbi:MAG: NADH-quinone oxidoreductase subunit C [Planctomycetaceae bacterium]